MKTVLDDLIVTFIRTSGDGILNLGYRIVSFIRRFGDRIINI